MRAQIYSSSIFSEIHRVNLRWRLVRLRLLACRIGPSPDESRFRGPGVTGSVIYGIHSGSSQYLFFNSQIAAKSTE
jgi:hypothetical protein